MESLIFCFFGTLPFQNLINFLIFQRGGSEFWGVQPLGYYTNLFISSNAVNMTLLITSLVYIVISLLVILYNSKKLSLFWINIKKDILLIRLIQLTGISISYLLFWELIPHKEERFPLPWLIFFLISQSLIIFLILRKGLVILTQIIRESKLLEKSKNKINLNQIKNIVIILVLFLLVVQNSYLFLNSDSTPYQEIELGVLYVGNQQDLIGLVVVFSRPHYIGTMAYLHQPEIPVLRIINSFLYENFSLIIPTRYNYLIIPHEYYSEFEFIRFELLESNFVIDKTIKGDYPVDVWKSTL